VNNLRSAHLKKGGISVLIGRRAGVEKAPGKKESRRSWGHSKGKLGKGRDAVCDKWNDKSNNRYWGRLLRWEQGGGSGIVLGGFIGNKRRGRKKREEMTVSCRNIPTSSKHTGVERPLENKRRGKRGRGIVNSGNENVNGENRKGRWGSFDV